MTKGNSRKRGFILAYNDMESRSWWEQEAEGTHLQMQEQSRQQEIQTHKALNSQNPFQIGVC